MGILYMKECLNKIEELLLIHIYIKISNILNWVNNIKNTKKT